MKSKKYEKIVEWEKKPNKRLIFLGIIFLIIASLNFISMFPLVYSSIEDLAFLLFLNGSIFTFLGLNKLAKGEGENKKVYYKEIK